MGSSGLGVAAFALEPPGAQGEQLLLAATAMAASVVVSNNPPGNQGGRVELTALGVTTPGTVTVNGTSPSGASINEVTSNIPAQASNVQSPEIGAFKYLTQKIFATVTSLACSAGLLTGGGLVRAESIVAEKYLFPADDFELNPIYGTESANEFSNVPVRHRNIQQLLLDSAWQYTQSLYPETSLAIAYLLFGAPVSVLPLAASTTLLKSAATSSPISLTPAVLPPGSILQFVVSGAGAAGTIVLAGTNFQGATIGETITASGNGTFPSTLNYWTITSITVTGLTGYSINVNSIGPSQLNANGLCSTYSGVTTQPALPGMGLIFVVSGASTGGSIVLAGTNPMGQAISETVIASGNGVFFTQNVYNHVTGGGALSVTGLTGGSMAVFGVFGWQYKFNDVANFDAFYTAMLALFDGTSTRVSPFAFIEEANWDIEKDKIYKITAKGRAQSATVVGDRTTTPLSTNRLSTLPTPPDQPVAGWQTAAWLDAEGTTPQTVVLPTLLVCKVAAKVPKQTIVPLTNSQKFQEAHDLKEGREFSIEATLNFKDVILRDAWRRNAKEILSVGALGPSIGFGGGTLYQKAWFWTMPFKFEGEGLKVDSTPAKANPEMTLKGMCEYSSQLGYSIQLTIQNQFAPTITN